MVIIKGLKITLPKDCCMNCGIVNKGKHLVADSNNGSNWKTIKIDLPDGEWHIWSSSGQNLTLVQYE